MRTVTNAQNIPQALVERSQWVCWQYVDKGKPKPDKVPVNAKNVLYPRLNQTTGQPLSLNASATWPNTWTTFSMALKVYELQFKLAGIGFVLTDRDNFVALDLDNCINAQGTLSNFAQGIIEKVGSYTEISPSGKGVRIICRSHIQINRKRPEIEIYSSGRFITITGRKLSGTLVEVCGATLESFLPQDKPVKDRKLASANNIFQIAKEKCITPKVSEPSELSHIWKLILADNKYGQERLNWFNGNFTGDHSLIAIKLLNLLAKHTNCNARQMKELIQMSGLYKCNQARWENRFRTKDNIFYSWIDWQIQDCINFVGAGSKGQSPSR